MITSSIISNQELEIHSSQHLIIFTAISEFYYWNFFSLMYTHYSHLINVSKHTNIAK